MHFNRGDIAVFSLYGEVEESERIQVFTAEILYEFIDIFDRAFHVLSSDCSNFECVYFR